MTTPLDAVRKGLTGAGAPQALVDELLEAFAEAKRRFYRNDLRPQEVEGGRFSEAAFRLLQWAATGTFTPLGGNLPRVPTLVGQLESTTTSHDSVRMHIPRTLRVIYDIRNNRDVAHLADGIDPNLQDATLVIRNMEWVLAEFVRLYHSVSANQAQALIEDLVTKEVPVIQEFKGFPKVLKTLPASEHLMLLIYREGAAGISRASLKVWALPAMRANTMRANMNRTLDQLEAKHLIHQDVDTIYVTRPGEVWVEEKHLLDPA